MTSKASRRMFLSGRTVAPGDSGTSSGDLADGGFCQRQYLGAQAAVPRLRLSSRAMACQFEVILPGRASPQAVEAAVDALELVAQLEERLSVFRTTSQLSRVNRHAATEPVSVDDELFELLRQALELSRATEGAFDITSTPLWRVWGFDRQDPRQPSQQELAAARDRVGSQLVRLDPQRRTVRFDRPGMELNLGAIGKGYALDRCADRLLAAGVDHFLLSGGYSSVLVKGNERGEGGSSHTRRPGEPFECWTVGLRHPLRPNVRVAELQLCNQALGTSATSFQFFRRQGKRLGHILDPRTGKPVERVLSATAIAPAAATADALSTAFVVMGLEACRRFCDAHQEVSALLVLPGKSARCVELHLVNFPERRLRPLEGCTLASIG